MNAILFDILNTIKSAIEARGLVGIGSANILVQKVPGNRAADLPAQQFPCIVIAPYGSEGLDPQAGTTSRDDVVYKVILAILAADNGDQSAHFNLFLSWRQSLRQLFHDQPLAALCFRVEVQPLDLARGKLRFLEGQGCRRLVQQLRDFPLSEHDDGPDALELALRMLQLAAAQGRDER